MATQPQQNQNVRFVRINGRIVPIRDKGHDNSVGKKSNPTPGYKNGYSLVRNKHGAVVSARRETNTPQSVLARSRVKSNEKVFKDSSGARYAISSRKATAGDQATRFGFGFVGGGIVGAGFGAGIGATAAAVTTGVATLAAKRFTGMKLPTQGLIGSGAKVGAIGGGLALGTTIGVKAADGRDVVTSRRIGVRRPNAKR